MRRKPPPPPKKLRGLTEDKGSQEKLEMTDAAVASEDEKEDNKPSGEGLYLQ